VELIVFVVIVVAVGGLGLWLGMLAAPHIGRLAERHDEEPDGAVVQVAPEAEPDAPPAEPGAPPAEPGAPPAEPGAPPAEPGAPKETSGR
jgi:hypothetical protein